MWNCNHPSLNIAFYRQINCFNTGIFGLVFQKPFRFFYTKHTASGNVIVSVLTFLRISLILAPFLPWKKFYFRLMSKKFVHMSGEAVQGDMGIRKRYGFRHAGASSYGTDIFLVIAFVSYPAFTSMGIRYVPICPAAPITITLIAFSSVHSDKCIQPLFARVHTTVTSFSLLYLIFAWI